MVRQDLVIGLNEDRIAVADRERRTGLHRCRGVDRFVLERGDVVGQWKVDGLDVGIFQPDGLQESVERRRIAYPRGIHRELHAFEVRERPVAPALDMVLADENFGGAVARRGRRFVGHDLDLDAARHRIVEPGRGGAGAGFDLAGPERRHHVRRRAKIGHFDVEAFVAEIALLVGDEDWGVARTAGRPDRYRLRGCCAGWRGQSVQACAYDKPERRLSQARFSPAIECSQFTNIRMREQLRPRADLRKFRACSFDGKVRRQGSRKGLRTPPSGSSAKMA